MYALKTRATNLTASLAVMLPFLLPTLVAMAVTQHRRIKEARDTGASTVEWILIITISATAAIAIGAMFVDKFTSTAQDLDLTPK